MSLAALRLQIASVVAGAPSASPGLPTGMAALDAALPGGGVPRGRISEWVAPAGLGKTTLARHLVRATLRAGLDVAWIDATRTLDPRDWAGTLDAIWVVRPPDPARAPWCADLLLRSGAFTLVVLDGGPVLPRPIAVRLAQLARESDAALLLLGDGTRATDGGAALRLRLARRGSPGRAVAMVEKGGVHSHHWDTQPIGLVRGPTIRTVTAQAARQGIRTGMTLPQARALCATLIAWPWDELTLTREIARASAAFLSASPQVTPLREAPGSWWIGAQGFDGIGGERQLATLLLRLARAWHPAARVAVADTCIAAQTGTWSTRAQREPVHIAPGEDAVYLMRVPLALLPMDDELRETLRALGLRTAGEVAALDPLDVERRWGAEGLALWRLA
nr:hypothetical protein [Gemmatimonadota bacterium]